MIRPGFITRRALLLSLPAVGLARPGRAQAAIALAEISSYFNSFTTARADFTQINADGSRASGRIMIHRPGRVRFEYDPPERSLVLASGGQVAIFDGRSNQLPTQYPLRRTPLNLILAREVDLTRDRMVVGHFAESDLTSVVVQDPEHPHYGSLRLMFSADPIALRQWVITDETRAQTTMILGDLEKSVPMSAQLFNITAEIEERTRR